MKTGNYRAIASERSDEPVIECLAMNMISTQRGQLPSDSSPERGKGVNYFNTS